MSNDPWVELASEGNFDLISRLHRAENKEPGFNTIVIDKKGFSPNDRTHNIVVRWLKKKRIHVLNVVHEVGNLELLAKEIRKNRKKLQKLHV
jgi:5,10-methylenetetrahydrofolate reductase